MARRSREEVGPTLEKVETDGCKERSQGRWGCGWALTEDPIAQTKMKGINVLGYILGCGTDPLRSL